MKNLLCMLIVFMCLLLAGCGGKWVADTFTLNTNPDFELKMTSTDCMSYNLTVTNKSKQDIEILWDKTLYIDETNTTNGGFMFGNELYYEDKDKSKKPMIVFANDTVTKNVYPAQSSYWKRGWRYSYLPAGRTGMYLTLKVGSEEVKNRLYVNVEY